MPRKPKKNPAAVALGKMTSPKKSAAARANGKKGGRPRKAQLLSHNDGTEFMCGECGHVAARTRDNPYPSVKHATGCSAVPGGPRSK